MQTEEILLKMVFSNQMLFCGIFGALGGVVHALDLSTNINLPTLISKIVISFITGLLLFFVTFDVTTLTPALRIAAALVAGSCGSALFRKIAQLYVNKIPGYFPISGIPTIQPTIPVPQAVPTVPASTQPIQTPPNTLQPGLQPGVARTSTDNEVEEFNG